MVFDKRPIFATFLMIVAAMEIGYTKIAFAGDRIIAENWKIFEDDTACSISNSYPIKNGEFIFIGMRVDGSTFIRMHRDNWSFEPEKFYEISLEFANSVISFTVRGEKTSDGSPGFMQSSHEDWLKAFSESKKVTVRNEGNILDIIDIKGAENAVAEVRACIVRLKANGADAIIIPTVRAVPLSSPWVTMADYPRGAMRDGRSGTSAFRLTIDKKGKPKACKIVESSGHTDLDELTCNLVLKRARFKPARAADGTAIPTTFQSRVNWRAR